jgi:hypothetical protein
VLYPIRFRDPLTGKWLRARYVAEQHEIATRYREWEIMEPPELRTHAGGIFNPWRRG